MFKALIFLFPWVLHGFYYTPWMRESLEFRFTPSYKYAAYTKIQSGDPKNFSDHEHRFKGELFFTSLGTWQAQLELAFNNTAVYSWNFEYVGISASNQLLNDIGGDPLSLKVGANFVYVTPNRLRSLIVPYQNSINFTPFVILGKEMDKLYGWDRRYFAFVGLQIPTEGRPALEADLFMQGRFDGSSWIGSVFLKSMWGMGSKTTIDPLQFTQWSSYKFREIHLGLQLQQDNTPWCTFNIEILFPIYAKTYPSNLYLGEINTSIPFSIF